MARLEVSCENCKHLHDGVCRGLIMVCDSYINRWESLHDGKDINTLTTEVEILNRVIGRKVKKLKKEAGY